MAITTSPYESKNRCKAYLLFIFKCNIQEVTYVESVKSHSKLTIRVNYACETLRLPPNSAPKH